MRPERLKSIIKAALEEGAAQVEVTLKTGETVRVQFAPTEKADPYLVEWKR